jgi:uncharacterized protein with HEPN domain
LRKTRLYLEDLAKACRKIIRFTQGMSRETFCSDERTYDAVVRNIEIIGEAAKQIPEHVRSRRADVQWRQISGLRDIVAHVYFGLDDDVLWDIVAGDVPALLTAAEALLATGAADEP